MIEWTVRCERTGKVIAIADSWFVYDRERGQWLIVAGDSSDGTGDYDLRSDQVIGLSAGDIMGHLTEKTWFDKEDFIEAVRRAYVQFFLNVPKWTY